MNATNTVELSEAAFSRILSRQRRIHGLPQAKKWANAHLPETPPYVIVGNPVNNHVALRKKTWGSNHEPPYQKGDHFLWYESAMRDPENGDHKGGGRGIFAIGQFVTDCTESRTRLWSDGVYPYRTGILIVRLFDRNLNTSDLKEILAPDASVSWRFVRRDRQLSEEEWSAIKPMLQRAVQSQGNN